MSGKNLAPLLKGSNYMSFTRCIMIGSGLGLCTGVVGSAFITGQSQKIEERGDLAGLILAGGASIAAPVCGVVGGAVAGGGFFATKKAVKLLPLLPPQARMVSAAITATAIGATYAYNIGKKQ